VISRTLKKSLQFFGIGVPVVHGFSEPLHWLLVARLGFLFGILTVVVLRQMLFQEQPQESFSLAYLLIGVGFLFNLTQGWVMNRVPPRWWMAAVQIVFDISLTTAWILLSGAKETIFALIYLTQILFNSLILYQKGAVGTAALAAVAFGIVMSRSEQTGGGLAWAIYSTLFLLLGLIGGYLSEELVRTAAKPHEKNESMKKLVGEHEQKLKQHEKLAAVGQLAAGIAHEIRNPLASVSASIEMLRQSPPETLASPENKKLMEIAQKEMGRLNRLITEFLDFVKPETITPVPVDITAMMGEVVISAKQMKECRDRIVFHEENGEATALGHSGRIRQVLWNLIMNAVQAIPTQGLLRVGSRTTGDTAIFWVEDNGVGMKPEVLQHLYEPFFTTKDRGTGLGLATAYKIVEAHRGEIKVTSTPGKGTRVEVHLPRA